MWSIMLSSVGVDLSGSRAALTSSTGELPSDPLIARIVVGAQIRMLESLTPQFRDVVQAYIFCGVLVANVRDLLVDPTLARQYATPDALPPDEARRPITGANLSRELDVPLETVRRQVKLMISHGALIATAHGLIAPTNVIRDGVAESQGVDQYQVSKLSLEFFRMLSALSTLT